MIKVRSGLVKGLGVSDCFPLNPKYFTQENFSQNLIVPVEKPDIEQLISVHGVVEVSSFRLVETPTAISNEGQNLSGYKLLVELKLKQRIKYVANVPTQSVHAAHYENILKNVFIVVPCEIDGQCIKELLRKKLILVTPYIEDILAKAVDLRHIYTNVNLFVDVEVKK